MTPRRVWLAVALGAVAWLLIAGLYSRYNTGNYAGYGMIVVLAFGLVPLGALGFAALYQWTRRWPLGALALVGGALPVVVAIPMIVSGELARAGQRGDEARAEAAAERARAELEPLPLAELAAHAADLRFGATAATIFLAKLERAARDCGDPAAAAAALRTVVAAGALTLDSFADVARRACAAWQPPLFDALVAGAAEQPGAADNEHLIVNLLEIDGGGALLSRVRARTHFSDAASGRALQELVLARTPARREQARTLLRLGFPPAAPESQPLSQLFREQWQEQHEDWPQGASADEVALYDALLAAEQKRR